MKKVLRLAEPLIYTDINQMRNIIRVRLRLT
jgi:hypothetical protein